MHEQEGSNGSHVMAFIHHARTDAHACVRKRMHARTVQSNNVIQRTLSISRDIVSVTIAVLKVKKIAFLFIKKYKAGQDKT